MRKKQLSLALALSAGLLSSPTLAQKSAEPAPGPAASAAAAPDVGEGLRKACAAWREDGPSEVLKVALRVPALRYEEGVLAVTLADRLALPESPRGTMDLVPDEATDVDSELAAPEASRLMRAQADGKLQTELYFELVRGRMNNSPCLTIAGGRHLRVTVAPLAIGLSQGGREQLRLLSERGAVVMPQGKPELLIDNRSLVYDGDPQDRASIEDALRGLSGKATACYQRALQRRPTLVGRLILGMDLDRDGRASDPRVEVDATFDADLGRCQREVFGELRIARPRRGGHLSVPLLFQRVARR